MTRIDFYIYPDENGSASASLYEDDGIASDYVRGIFRHTNVSYRKTGVLGEIVLNVEGRRLSSACDT